jgi:hypothetical protein
MKSPKNCGGTSAFPSETSALPKLAGKLLFGCGNYDTDES